MKLLCLGGGSCFSTLTAVLFIPLLEAGPMASMLAVSGSSRPIFAAAWLLVLLALGMVVTAVLT